MADKYINNDAYASGYALNGSYSQITIGPSGSIGGTGVISGTNESYTILNLGQIESTAPGASGISLQAGGTITNGSSTNTSASIIGAAASNGGVGGSGITLAPTGSVINFGTILGGAGSTAAGAPMGYNGGDGSSGGSGIVLSAGGITNSGAITGGLGGAGEEGGNFGLLPVPSAVGGVGGYGGTGVPVGAGEIANTGAITGGTGGKGGAGGYGLLYLNSFSSIPVDGGAGGTGGAGIVLTAPGSIDNSGTIVGGDGGTGGYGGKIVGEAYGYNFAGSTGDGGNGGAGGTGVVLTAGGSVTNLGTIAGSAGGAGGEGRPGFWVGGYVNPLSGIYYSRSFIGPGATGATGTEGDGIILKNGGSVTNDSSGAIDGLVGIQATGGATITNYGTIDGSGGSAIQFSGSGNTLIVEPGAVFEGTVTAGGGANEIDFAKTGTISLAPEYVGFSTARLGDGGANSMALSDADFSGVASGAALTVFGGDGGNTIDASGDTNATAGKGLTYVAGSGSDSFTGGFENDQVVVLAQAVGGDTLTGGGGANTLTLITPGSADLSGVSGFGTIDLAAGGNAITLADLNLTGVVGGTITFEGHHGGSNSFTGSISGSGTLVFDGGGDQIDSGTTIVTSSLSLSHGATVAFDEIDDYGGKFSMGADTELGVGAGQTLALSAASTLAGTLEGPGTLQIDGTASLGGATLESGLLDNAGTVNETGTLTQGSGNVVNQATDHWNIVGGAAIAEAPTGDSLFTNAGIFTKTDSAGTATVGVTFDDTGSVAVTGGTLKFAGRANSFAGAITGKGAIEFSNGGNANFNAGTLVATSDWSIDSLADVTLNTALTYAGAFAIATSCSLTISAGKTLTVSGSFNAGGGQVTGAGTLLTTGTARVTGIFSLSGTAVWQNSASLTLTQGLNLALDTSTRPDFVNAAKGTVVIAGSDPFEVSSKATVENLGMLEKTGAVPTSVVDTNFIDSGTIDIAQGTLAFDGPASTFAGKIEGASATSSLSLLGGTVTLGSGFALQATNWSIAKGVKVADDVSLTYAGMLLDNASTLTLAGKAVLTLTGGTTFAGSTVDKGGLTTTGATQVKGLTLGGATDWLNYGTVTETVAVIVGDISGKSAVLINEAKAVYDLTDNAGIGVASGAVGSFANGGTLEKTGSTGTSTVALGIANTGVIAVSAGRLDLLGAITGTGTMAIRKGAMLELDSSVAKAQTVAFGAGGGRLALDHAAAFAARITGFSGASDAIDFAGFNGSAKKSYIQNAQKTGGTLTITDGSLKASINLFGQYVAAGFNLKASTAGVELTYTPRTSLADLAASHG